MWIYDNSKTRGIFKTLRILIQEILSYYGQFTFFSLLVTLDLLLYSFIPRLTLRLPLTSAAFLLLASAFLLLTPFRVLRDFKRIKGSGDVPVAV